MAAFLAILGATLSGLAGLGPWAIAIAAVALWASSRAEYDSVYAQAEQASQSALAANVSFKSAMNAGIATTCAFSGGAMLRLLT